MSKTNEIRMEYLSSTSFVYTGAFNGEVYGVIDRLMAYLMYLKEGETLGIEIIMQANEPNKNYIYLDSDKETCIDEFDWIFSHYAKVIPDKYILANKDNAEDRVRYRLVVDESMCMTYREDDLIYKMCK